MYIYGGDPNWWAHFGQKSQFFPSFIVKFGQEKPPQKRGGFSCFQVFSSFFFLPFFAFVFLLSLCISTSWSLKRYPPGGVSGIYIYIYGGGLVFCLLFWLFGRQKQHILAILRQKKGKGRNKKDDQNRSCFFWSKSALFPPVLSKKLPKT